MPTNIGKSKRSGNRKKAVKREGIKSIGIICQLQKQEKAYSVLKFLVKFNLFAIPLYIILWSNFQWAWLEDVTANTVYVFLQVIGIAVEKTGNFLIIPVLNGHWGAFISWDCTAWKSFLALFALIMATDFSLKGKVKGLAVLLPAIFLVNIIRIVFMFYFVYSFDLAYFDLVHAVIWSWGLIIIVLAFWTAWMKWSLRVQQA